MKAGKITLSKLLSLLSLFTLTLILANAATSQSQSQTKQLKAFSLEVSATASPTKPTQEEEPEALTLADHQQPNRTSNLKPSLPNDDIFQANGKSHLIRAPPHHT